MLPVFFPHSPSQSSAEIDSGSEFYEPIAEALELRQQGIVSIDLESQVFVDEDGEVCSIADYLEGGN